MTTFKELIPDEQILKAIERFGFTEPTEIQTACIPPAMAGKDLIGQAKTGSGKTLAFGIPIMQQVTRAPQVQALIIAPTRELVAQIAVEIGKLTHGVRIATVFGGVSIRPQIEALRSAQVVIGTPGRLLDHLGQGTLETRHIKILVFDEADRMFDMGFLHDIERIVQHVPRDRQTLLFSATMPDPIKRLASRYQRDPVHVKTHSHVEHNLLPQVFYRVPSHDKFSLLVHVIKQEDPSLAIIFHKTKHGAKALARNLAKHFPETDAMHGNLSQQQRDRVLSDFKTGKLRLLVATDVAARGLDVKHVSHVFNFNVSHAPEDYVHRIGRTARAGASGKAVTLVEPEEERAWRDILRLPQVSAIELKPGEFPRISFQKRASDHDDERRGPQHRPQGGGAYGQHRGARPQYLQRSAQQGGGQHREHRQSRDDGRERSERSSGDAPRPAYGRPQQGGPRRKFRRSYR